MSLLLYSIGLYRHKREAATHIFAVMISPEARNRKPYALPVQLISYVGLNQDRIRTIINGVIREMEARSMDVCGTYTVVIAYALMSCDL